jgi:hypothetical protein
MALNTYGTKVPVAVSTNSVLRRHDRGRQILRASSIDDGLLVGREAGTLGQERSNLALELTDGPVSLKTFRFVKGPFERIVDPDKFDEMRSGEP